MAPSSHDRLTNEPGDEGETAAQDHPVRDRTENKRLSSVSGVGGVHPDLYGSVGRERRG